MANNNYKVATNVLVSDIIDSGTTNSNYYVGFPSYSTSSLTFEKHNTLLGYKVDETDINPVAFYRDYEGGNWTVNNTIYNVSGVVNSGDWGHYNYGNTMTASGTIPSWCTSIRVIVIGAGGGGGGGGANARNGQRTGSGGGGGGAGIAAGTISSVTSGSTYNITLGGCGLGGNRQYEEADAGIAALNPNSISTTFYYGSSVLTANCGGVGQPGPPAAGSGAKTNQANASNVGNTSTTLVNSVYVTSGNIGNKSDDQVPGVGGTINNNSDLPILNSTAIAPAQGENTQLDQHVLPPYGTGGYGGWNSNAHDSGFRGQSGGRSFVRVYFIR